jgi:hypothetical protein
VEIHINFEGNIFSEIAYKKGELSIGNVKNITVLDKSGPKGRKVNIIVGGKKTNYLFDANNAPIFANNLPSSATGVQFYGGYRTTYNIPAMTSQKIGF